MKKRTIGIIIVTVLNLFLFTQFFINALDEILMVLLMFAIFNGVALFLSWIGYEILKYTKKHLWFFSNMIVLGLFFIAMVIATFTDPTWDALLWALLAVGSIFAMIEIIGIYLIIYDKYILKALVVKKEQEWYERES